MTTANEAVKAALDSHAALQALVGNGDSPETYRIHPVLAPQGTARPYVAYQLITGVEMETMDGGAGAAAIGTQQLRYRFICYDEHIIDAKAVSDAVRGALRAATAFKAVHVFEADDYELDTGLYSVTSDYSIWYK